MNKKATTFAIFLTYFVFAILLNSVGTVILQVINSFGVEKTAAARLEGFKDLPIALVSFACAAFLPRFGFRKAMIVGVGCVGLACLAMPLVPSFLTTKLLFLVVGFSFALVKVSAYSTVGLLADGKKQHVSLLSTMEGVFMVGMLSGYWIFSAFIDPANEQSLSWVNVYWLLSGICAVTMVILFATPFDESQARTDTQCRMRDLFVAKWKLLGRSLVIVFVISAFLYVLIEQGIGTWLPTFNNQILHLPQDMSVQAASIFAGCLAIGRLSAGAVMHRFNWYAVSNVCVLAMAGLVLVSMPLTRGLAPDPGISWLNAPLAAYIFPLIGLFMAPIYPTISSVMLSALPRHQHSAMTGLIVVFSALGGTTGSIITGKVFEVFDGQTAFYMSLIPLGGILVSLFFFRRASEKVVHDDHPDVEITPEVETVESAAGR